MRTVSVERLGGLSLIVGPIVSFISFPLRPGVLLIDRADSTDEVAQIMATASNSMLTHVTGLLGPGRLILTLYGLYVAQSHLRDGGAGDALTRLGFMALAVGTIGWVTGFSLQHVSANTELGVAGATAPVYAVQSGVTLLSTLLVALGFLFFSLDAAHRSEFNKVGALAIAAVSLVSAASLTVGIILPETAAVSVALARAIYFFWVNLARAPRRGHPEGEQRLGSAAARALFLCASTRRSP